MADGVLARLAVAIQADTQNFQRGTRHLKKDIVGLRTTIDNQLGRLAKVSVVGGLAAGVGMAGAAVAKLNQQFDQMRAEIDATAKRARMLGLTFDQLSNIRFAADLEGISGIDTAIQRATRRISEAAAGTGEARAALAELGLSAQGLNQMDPAAQLEAIAVGFGRVASDADRLRLAVKLFDSEGAAMVRLLDGGATKVRGLYREAQFLRGEFGGSAAVIERFNDQIRRGQEVITGLSQRAIVPAIVGLEMFTQNWHRMADALPDAIPGVKTLRKELHGLREGMDLVAKTEELAARITESSESARRAGAMSDPATEALKIANQDAEKLLATLDDRLGTLRRGENHQIDALRERGADETILQQIEERLQAERDITKEQERRAKLETKAARMQEQALSAEQRLRDTAAEIAEMRQRGMLNAQIAKQAEQEALQSFVDNQGKAIMDQLQRLQQFSPGSLMARERGSMAAFESIDRTSKRSLVEIEAKKQTSSLKELIRIGRQQLRQGADSVTVKEISI